MPVSSESREQLGRALAEAREEAGLTVVQLAQRANPGRAGGLSRYYDAEAGRRMATSETVGHYVRVLGRQDLYDLRSKILSKRPAAIQDDPTDDREVDELDRSDGGSPDADLERADRGVANDEGGADLAMGGGSDALPRPELLPSSLDEPLRELIAEVGPLEDGTVVRGRRAIVAAACALVDEAISICADEGSSVSVQVVQLNSERSFTRITGGPGESGSQLFPYQIQRLIEVGGSVRHLLSYEIMHTIDMWAAFERFIALMELAGDYSVYWPSRFQSRARMPDYLVIEGVAALEVFPTDPLTWSGDAAVVRRHPSDALSVVKDYGENLIAEADEAFQVTDPSSTYAVEQARVWVEQAILEAEQSEGPRFVFKYGLTSLTEPLKSYEARLLDRHGLDAEDRAAWPTWVKQDLELRRRRLANFLRRIEKHRAIDVIPRSALRHFVEHGRYSPDCAEFGEYTVPVEDRIQHLEDVITMISTNERYDLIVMDDDPPITHLVGAAMLMMGRPEDPESPWMIFYQSEKPGRDGTPISVAFETSLDMFRDSVGSRIARFEEAAKKGATQRTLRILHGFIDDLRHQRSSA